MVKSRCAFAFRLFALGPVQRVDVTHPGPLHLNTAHSMLNHWRFPASPVCLEMPASSTPTDGVLRRCMCCGRWERTSNGGIMTGAIDKLLEERKRLEARLAEISDVLDEYHQLVGRASALLGGGAHVDTTPAHIDPGQDESDGATSEAPTPTEEYESVLRAVLEDAVQPLQRKELLDKLKSRGVIVGGANELNALGTRLYRTPWVVNLKGYGYWLKARDYPRANHFNPSGVNRDQARRNDPEIYQTNPSPTS